MEELERERIFDALGDCRSALASTRLDAVERAEVHKLAAVIENQVLEGRLDDDAAWRAAALHGLMLAAGSEAGRPLAKLLSVTARSTPAELVARRRYRIVDGAGRGEGSP